MLGPDVFLPVSMMHGVDPVSLHIMPAPTIAAIQQPEPRLLQLLPPHVPHSAGQHTFAASTPSSPLLQEPSVLRPMHTTVKL